MPSHSADDVRPLRLLQIVHGLGRGGLENGVVNLLNGLPAERFEQAVCCLDQGGEMAARIARPLPLHVLHRGRHDLRLPLRLARLLRRWRPDVVHCRNWNTWPDTLLAHRLAGRPGTLVWSFHGFADGHWFPRRRRIASRLLAGRTDRLFAVCRDSAERFAGLAGIPPERFGVLYNGVDCETFRPATDRPALRRALGWDDDECIVLTVASLTPVKGHDQLLEAAARVLAGQAPARRPRFVWLGEGAERPALERRIAELGLGAAVTLPGASDRVPEALAAADLFVLPSRLEGMSNAILEAMASGLPVVANAVGGNPELIQDGICGLLARAGDGPDLADAIGRLVADDALRTSMGLAARARAESVFSLESMMARYADFYAAAAAPARPPPADPGDA
jgi:sugar transferase (PEP-CTERM/EpsH1 system associated)